MTDVIAYRGPDDAGYVSGDGCSLGARRLSIIDVEGGHQPFADERGRVWAAQNGEIYNHDALREGARGARPRAAQPLRHRGPPAPLRGARPGPGRAPARDVRRRGLGPGRAPRRADPRPARASSRSTTRSSATSWSSAPSSSACSPAASSAPELDPEAIAAYLTLGYVPGSMTPLRQVRKLEPGERLVVADGRATVERWWTLPGPRGRPGRALRRRVGRDPAREARRVGAHAAHERRAARRDAQRRPRLEPDRRADGPAHEPSR